jgi:hypothetical protein
MSLHLPAPTNGTAHHAPRIRSALFVDFENIYVGLSRTDTEAAEFFARKPGEWLRWLERIEYAGEPTSPGQRAILIRNCYLNPVTSNRFRAFFTRSAFRVVDCPPLTAQGKNSADINLVMDVLDALIHPTHFDEVIIMSADADFTPVMLRLRSHDRRTVIVTSGPTAQAFKAACDVVISDEEFIEQALSGNRPLVLSRSPGSLVPTIAADGETQDTGQEELRARIIEHVAKTLAEADAPIVLATLAGSVIQEVGPAVRETEWAGAGSFSALLRAESDPGFAISPTPPGYLYDPARHRLPEEPHDPLAGLPPDLADLIDQVSGVTGVPRLTPEDYRVLFEELQAEIEEMGYRGNETSKAVRDRCALRDRPIARKAVAFVIGGLFFSDYWSASRTPARSAFELAEAFRDNTLTLCRNARMELDDQQRALFDEWLCTGLGT